MIISSINNNNPLRARLMNFSKDTNYKKIQRQRPQYLLLNFYQINFIITLLQMNIV